MPLATAFLGYALLFTFVLLVLPLSGDVLVAYSDIGAILPAFAAAACAIHVGRRAAGRAHRGWLLVGGGLVFWGMGETLWSFYEVVLGTETPFPSPADVFYLLGIPVTLAGIVWLTSPSAWTMRLRNGLDALAVAMAVTAIAWDPIVRPVLTDSDSTLLEKAIAGAYPLGDMSLIFALVMALPRNQTRAVSRILITYSAGLLLFTAADLAFAYLSLDETYASGSLVDAGWIGGYSLMGVAAALSLRQVRSMPQTGFFSTEDDKPSRLQVLPLATLPFLAAWLVIKYTVADAGDIPAMTAGVIAIALVVGRQVLSFSDALDANRKLALAHAELAHANALLQQRNVDLELDLISEQERSSRDALTGILNRRAIESKFSEALAEAEARHGTMAIALVDTDSMKDINDRYGHQEGDTALRAVASILSGSAGAMAGRIGGDEFLVVLREGDRESCADFERGVRRDLRERSQAYPAGVLDVSLGTAVYPDDGVTVEQLVAVADSRMYQMKASKRNILARRLAA